MARGCPYGFAAGLVLLVAAGCRSVEFTGAAGDTGLAFVPTRFKPVYEVMKDVGPVRGEAVSSYWLWGVFKDAPKAYVCGDSAGRAAEHGLKQAAIMDACCRSGASVILTPHFRTVSESGFLGFRGETRVFVEGMPARLVDAEESVQGDGAEKR